MAFTPGQMMNLRRGPTMGPQPTGPPGPTGGGPPGQPGAPGAGMPATPGAQSPGNMLMTAIAQKMGEQKKANANFAVANLDQVQRVVAASMIHLMQMHPDAARHLNRAWAALDQAKKALKDAVKEEAVPTGPPLGFSGAGIGPQAGGAGPPGVGPGAGGGGMGTPS